MRPKGIESTPDCGSNSVFHTQTEQRRMLLCPYLRLTGLGMALAVDILFPDFFDKRWQEIQDQWPRS